MSRTFKDTSDWVRRRGQGRPASRPVGGVPRAYVQSEFNRPERHASKIELQRGDEPFPH